MEDDKNLRREILEKVKEYYKLAFKKEAFVPEKSRVHYGGRVFDEKEMVSLVDAALDFWLTEGRYAERFEKKLAAYLGVKHSFLVNSGSSANLLAFMALTSDSLGTRKIERGDEVVTVAASFPTTVTPIVQYGAIPVFVDVDLATYNIDVKAIEKAISGKTKAVMLAHTLGNPFQAERVKKICKDHGLWLIEDNCDSLGAKYRGKYTGTFGDISTSSFYPAHHITTGEGGAVYTDNPSLANILLSMRDWGRDCRCRSGQDNLCGRRFSGQFGELPKGYDHKYVYSNFGYNLKVTEMQAAVGCAQMDKLTFFIEERNKNHRYLSDRLRFCEDLLILPVPTEGSEPSWFGFAVTVKNGVSFTRGDLVAHLEKANIQTRMLFGGNLIKHPCFDAMRNDGRNYRVVGDLANTEKIMRDTFWVGVYPGMTKEMLDYTVSKFINFSK